jgi:hypothetical protein
MMKHEFISDENKFLGKFDLKNNFDRQTQFPTLYLAGTIITIHGKISKLNHLLVKYEDLIEKPEKTFGTITKFLCKLLDLKVDKQKILEAIEHSSFNKLKKDEEKLGLIEAPVDHKTKIKKQFFYLGPKNNWKKILPTEIKHKIEKRFEKEMKVNLDI